MSVRSITASAGFLVLVTVSFAAAQSQPVRPPSEREQLAATRQVQGFNIVLVLGETQLGSGVEGSEDIPPGARKALADMREFLPYKHYRVLDTQWTSCCAGLNSVLAGQLRGIALGRAGGSSFVDRQYSFELTVNNLSQGLSVRFALSDKAAVSSQPSETDQARQMALQRQVALQVERQELKDQIATMELRVQEAEKKVAVGAIASLELRELQDRHKSLQRQYEALGRADDGAPARSGGGIVDSSFIMQPGETVVVGTSRLGGDKAIIALVTAAKKAGASK